MATSPITSSPRTDGAHVGRSSIASTITDISSNLESPTPLQSPDSSGALSPADVRSQADSAARTFKSVMQQKKMGPPAQSAIHYNDADSLAKAKFEQLLKTAELVKPAPNSDSREKNERKSIATKGVKSPTSLRREKNVAFTEMTADKFFGHFPFKPTEQDKLLKVDVGRSAVCYTPEDQAIYSHSVMAHEMSDALAVFCLSKDHLSCHHFSSGENFISVFHKFVKTGWSKNLLYNIYIVGGDGSTESVQLLATIQKAIFKIFKEKGKIQQMFLEKRGEFPYVSVACTQKGEFSFCKHE
jgi:hypothetical protein